MGHPGQRFACLFLTLKKTLPFLWCAATLSAADLGDPSKLPPAAASYDFDQDVRAVFETACLHCHNADKEKGGLRLDTRERTLKGGDEHPALVPGKSGESPLIHFAARLVDEMEMPPKGKGDQLTPEQIGKLRAWIDAGAPWPVNVTFVARQKVDIAAHEKLPPTQDPAKLSHWAFKPPVRPPVPGPGNAIDAFVRARLKKEGLAPSPEAAPETLCRRMYLDLLGLPPKPAEVDAFVQAYAANADHAIGQLADQLLASPHYGERWGRHWLDAARYADSDGYEKDKPRTAHFYRDWVIGAFNRDLPYNQFIIEQLAGDELPSPTQDQIVATGFLRNSLLNEEGGVDPEQFRMEAMFDRMDCLGKAVLGLTLNCTQCHDHKFDPFTQEEYYRMFAFLNNDHEAQPRVWSPDDLRRRADVLRQVAEEEAKLQHTTADWPQKMAAWEDAWRAQIKPEWKVIRDLQWDENDSAGGMRYLRQKDGSWLTAGFQPVKHNGIFYWKTPVEGITGFRLETLHDPDLPGGGPGRSFLGTFAVSEFAVEFREGAAKGKPVKWAKATADLSAQPETAVHPNFNEKKPVHRVIGPASYAIDGKDDTGWSSDLGPGRRNEESTIVFAAEKPLANADAVTFKIGQKIGGWNADDLQANALGRLRLSYTTASAPEADPVPPRVRAALEIPRAQRTPAQTAVVFSHWRTTVPEWREANERIEKIWAQHPEGSTQFTLTPLDQPRMTSILKRGDWLKPDRAVQPGVLKVLNPLPAGAPPTRLTFARWLVDRQSPTAARALVNRVWQAYFGTGFVSTSEDFGTQSEPPSHPELLDWLAVQFMDTGWKLKPLHKLIVTSATYRQSSRVTPELLAKDPYNRLLARGSRLRVEGEVVRDLQLAASGLLNDKVGGRALMPPAPAFLFVAPASYAPFPWIDETGDDRYRRAVYTWRRRTTPYPFLQVFDTPEGNTSCVRRVRSNTPLQALTTLNETISLEAAQALARRMSTSGASDAERLAFGFRCVTSRRPTEDESHELLAFLGRTNQRLAGGQLKPALLVDAKTPPASTTPTQLAAYTAVARVLLNLDEAFTKE